MFLLGWLLIRSALPQIVSLARTPDLPMEAIGSLLWSLTVKLLTWTVAAFAGIALLDVVYQRWSFTKKMRMSMRDIKQEMKESEGDPYIKGQRRQLAQELAQRGATQAARNANVLVVNPTHVAIAIDYDRETCPVPTIAAKGEDHVALAMRQAAEEAGVPIVRNIPLARDMLARAEIGEIVPADLFDIIAEVILWAREVREQVQAQREAGAGQHVALPPRRIAAPGEDLTHYQGRCAPTFTSFTAPRGGFSLLEAAHRRLTMESFALSFLSMLLALGVVLALAWVGLRLLRNRMQPRPSAGGGVDDALRFVRALPVGPKERVVIVEHRGARWMLGVTAGGISTIAQWPSTESGRRLPQRARRAWGHHELGSSAMLEHT